MTKFCVCCKEEKSLSSFSLNRSTKDGLRKTCKKCDKDYRKRHQKEIAEYRENNKKYMKGWWINNKDKCKKYNQNKKEYYKEWVKNNKDKKTQNQIRYANRKRAVDVLFKLKMNIRNLIRNSIKKNGFTKSSKTNQILGCSFEEFKQYLFENANLRYPDFKEKDFLENNKYQIDHIIPLATAKTEEEIIKLNHYTNLQLLTTEDNLKKSDKMI